jgi:hypothetical protein
MQREWTDRLLEDADTGQQSRWKWWRGLKTKMKENMGAGMVIGVVGANLLFLGGGLGLLVSNGRDIGSGDGEWVWAVSSLQAFLLPFSVPCPGHGSIDASRYCSLTTLPSL